jgi:putative endonuclease
MADPRHLLGVTAEARVATWLAARGWTVLATRHREAGGGEVDLVALDPTGVLVAVEVKARRTGRAGSAAAAMDPARARRLARTLTAFAASARTSHRGLRIDLVTVEPVAGAERWMLRRLPWSD